MKKIAIVIICLSMHSLIFSQVLKEIDDIYPLQEDLIAVKKGVQWAFVNNEGVKVIDFRDDLVTTKKDNANYPMFVEGRCLIKKMIDGIYYYGYINKEGKTLIEPQFLNATNFMKGHAIIIKLDKRKIGGNSILGKSLVNSKLEEYAIDTTGKTVKYLEGSRGYIPENMKGKTPKFNARFITPNLIAVKNKNKKWDIYKL